MSTIKDKLADAGHAVTETAKNVGHKIAEGAEKAVDFVKAKTGIGEGKDVGVTGIKTHMMSSPPAAKRSAWSMP